jgi:hypothetical protein
VAGVAFDPGAFDVGYGEMPRLRLPFDAPLPPAGVRRYAVLAALLVGGLVALLVPVFFAIVLFELLRGG